MKNSQVFNFSTGTDTTLLMKTRELWSKHMKRTSEPFKRLSKSNLKSLETNTLKRCLKMPPNSKSCKQKRKKKPDNSKKL